MAQRSGSQGACIAHRCERQSACMAFKCASRSACMAHACPDKYGIRIGCLTPAFWEAHKWAEMLHHPCFLGDPQQRGHSQSKMNRNKNFPMASLALRAVLQIASSGGLNPGYRNRRGTALPTRVWPISDIPLHRGGIDIWSNLVFIHHWVLLKKLSSLSIDTWGENPFFHSTKSSKNSLGRLWRPWSSTSGPKPSREGEGGESA